LKTVERDILKSSGAGLPELRHAYSQTLRLQSQILSLIYDREAYGLLAGHEYFSKEMSRGENRGAAITLTIYEPLPSMKRLTEAIEEHWKAMIHAAIEEADIVLMDDDPMKIAKAIRISRKCLGIVYQNIVMALGVKAACLVLGAAGIANMYLAIFADVGVMILAVLNAIRCLFVRKL